LATITIGRKLSYLTDSVTAAQGLAGSQAWLVAEQNQLVPTKYDRLEITYHPTLPDLISTVVYRQGGVVVATLNIVYDNGNIVAVTRT